MDLPPCPVCGGDLHVGASQGVATCPACGFKGPVEVDRRALNQLVESAADRGLGQRPALGPSGEAPEPRLEGNRTPSMLDGPRAPELPKLSPPPVPAELSASAPPRMADPRSPLPKEGGEATTTQLKTTLEERDEARRRELRARGELLR